MLPHQEQKQVEQTLSRQVEEVKAPRLYIWSLMFNSVFTEEQPVEIGSGIQPH